MEVHTLGSCEYARVSGLYDSPHADLVFRSVVEGHTRAAVWSDADSEASLMWEGHGLFVVGDPGCESFVRDLPTVLSAIAEKAEVGGMRWLKLSCGPNWENTMQMHIPGTFKRARTLYRSLPKEQVGAVPEGYTVEPIDSRMLLEKCFSHAEGVIDEVKYMWPSIERFLDVGFGKAVCFGERVVCWCTSEYISPGMCGIGIETTQEHQGRGLATAAAVAFVEEASKRDLVAHWDCWTDNAPSMKVARKAGFEIVEEYDVLLVEHLRIQP